MSDKATPRAGVETVDRVNDRGIKGILSSGTTLPQGGLTRPEGGGERLAEVDPQGGGVDRARRVIAGPKLVHVREAATLVDTPSFFGT